MTQKAREAWCATGLKILSYLNGTYSFGITFVWGSGLGLEVYADADYADKANDKCSVSGMAVTLGGTVVSHASKTQHVVSLSTSEAEYIAAGDGVKEALFVRTVLSFIVTETSGASIKVLNGNQGAKALIENPLSSSRSKHIDVRFHFIRDLFRIRKISVEYVESAEQHADILTKALSRANFQYHRERLYFGIRYFSTGQVVSSNKCTSRSPEAGRPRTKLVKGNVSDKAPCTEIRSTDSQ